MSDAATANAANDPILQRALDFNEKSRDYWNENHETGRLDLRFSRLEEQWHESDRLQREEDKRPCETFSKMGAFIRQVVNDARQNKPSIKVHPADDKADPETAELYNGLIRNIEVVSNADAAYDTGLESGVDKGFGYWRINVKYACDDSFDRDILIERVANAFTVFPDYRSQAVDSSDWNECIVVTQLSKEEFTVEYPKAEKVNWDFDFQALPATWFDGEMVTVAEYWVRDKVMRTLVSAGGNPMWMEDYEKLKAESPEAPPLDPVEPEERPQHKVTQYICSGAEVLKKVEWAGKYIPIVPVWGDEIVTEDGKRLFRSMIHSAKGAQRMYNYMRNTGIEMVGLAPKAPYIGEEGAFDADSNWDTANTQTHAYLEYKAGKQRPMRDNGIQINPGVIQETLAANDDMKAIIGMYDASLGRQGNETSGKAIRERKIEGDTATFHFIDNQNRAIRHTGLILIDLIPKVYTPGRILRVMGDDMKPRVVPTGQPTPQLDKAGKPVVGEDGNPIMRVYDLTAGKYDLTVSSGPSFASRREEVSQQLVEMAQAGGEVVASVLAPRIAKLQDIPDADEIAEEIEKKLNPQQNGLPPQVQQQMQQGMAEIQRLTQENASLKQGQQMKGMELQAKGQEAQANNLIRAKELELKQKELEIKERELEVKLFEAQTDRIQAMKPEPQPTAFSGPA